MRPPRKKVLPGFGPTFALTFFYLTLIVLIPLLLLFLKSVSIGPALFWNAVTSPRVIASYLLSFGTSLAAALTNALFGSLLAWVLVRYRFRGKWAVELLIDLPFALPTAVAGIALTTVFAGNGLLGSILERFGIKAAFTPLGIMIALTFIGLPFVVRSVQPVLEDLDREMEEAAVCLGANRLQTLIHVMLPMVLPAVISGFAMAFARALGEYGSVVFIAGNIPMKTEITPLLIVTKLEQYDYAGATAVAAVMLAGSFVLLFAINRLQGWAHNRHRTV